MQINLDLPEDVQQKLAAKAAVNGCSNVEELATRILGLYAEQPESIEQLGSDHWAYDLTEEQLAESVRSCEIGIQQAKNGESVPFEQAMQEIADELGLDVSQ